VKQKITITSLLEFFPLIQKRIIKVVKKKFKKIYNYKCTITEKEFKTTAEAPNPEDLTCVSAYYELNPENDDRPEHIKITLKSKEVVKEAPKEGVKE
jgi:hypothetical protein